MLEISLPRKQQRNVFLRACQLKVETRTGVACIGCRLYCWFNRQYWICAFEMYCYFFQVL